MDALFCFFIGSLKLGFRGVFSALMNSRVSVYVRVWDGGKGVMAVVVVSVWQAHNYNLL